jgi:hypothetical protein
MKSALAGLVAVLLLAAPVAAQPQPAPMKLQLAYDGRLFFKVLDIEFDQTISAYGFGSSVRMRSYGILAAFKRIDLVATSQGRFEDGEVRPISFSYVHHDGARVRRVGVTWTGGDVTMTASPAFANLGEPPASRAQKLAAADPLTQLIRVAMSAKPTAACGTTSRFFDGKQLYALEFGRAEPASLSDDERAMGLTAPVQCTVRYVEIAGFKAKPPAKRNQGLNGPIMAVMAQYGRGGPWIFTSLSADTSLGRARIYLRHMQVTGTRP